jgi:hypothetical protein
MSVSEQQKFKLLILQVRFLREKLSLHKEIEEEAGSHFSKSFKNTLKEMPENVKNAFRDEEDKQEEEKKQKFHEQVEETQQKVDREEEHQILSKKQKLKHLKAVYKEVAKITHPDKLKDMSELERLEKENLFIKAGKAMDEGNLIDLMDVALHLKVPFPDPSEEDFQLAKEKVDKIRAKIKKIENTTAWRWYHSDEEEKPLMMKDYINYIHQNLGD